MTCSKHRYRSAGAARWAARSLFWQTRAAVASVYYHGDCQAWHVTTKPGKCGNGLWRRF